MAVLRILGWRFEFAAGVDAEDGSEPELTAGDNGGTTYAERFETGFARTDYGKPECDPNLSPPDWENL